MSKTVTCCDESTENYHPEVTISSMEYFSVLQLIVSFNRALYANTFALTTV